jgi:hypothetical protein
VTGTAKVSHCNLKWAANRFGVEYCLWQRGITGRLDGTSCLGSRDS